MVNLMPRRIPDFPDYYHSWNFLSSIGSGITLLAFLFLGIAEMKGKSSDPIVMTIPGGLRGEIPQVGWIFTDELLTNSPPRPAEI